MGNTPETSTTRTYTVSRKQTFALAATLITTIGAVAVAYYNNRPDDADRWYGRDGRATLKRVIALEERSTELERWRVLVDLQLQGIDTARNICDGRISKIEAAQDRHESEFDEHVRWGRGIVREFSVTDARIQVRLDECLKRTGLKP